MYKSSVSRPATQSLTEARKFQEIGEVPEGYLTEGCKREVFQRDLV
jgi:hypothetical protein